MLKSMRNGLLGLAGFLGACSEYNLLERVPPVVEPLPIKLRTDVTSSYGPKSDVRLFSQQPGQFIYLGVMDKNPDTSLGTATVAVVRTDKEGNADFKDVGSDRLFYIPYTYQEENGEPHARTVDFPFVLERDGTRRIFGFMPDLNPLNSELRDLEVGRTYELARFAAGQWNPELNFVAGKEGTAKVPLGHYDVYVLRGEDGRYSRPFALTDGKIEKF